MIPADPTPCRRRPELFTTPEGERLGSDTYLERVGEAKQLCAACPIRTSCLTEARANRSEGVWGGEDDIERARATGRRLKVPREPLPLAACGTRGARRRHARRREPCEGCNYRPREQAAAVPAAA